MTMTAEGLRGEGITRQRKGLGFRSGVGGVCGFRRHHSTLTCYGLWTSCSSLSHKPPQSVSPHSDHGEAVLGGVKLP